jgi:aspartyl protease family protein
VTDSAPYAVYYVLGIVLVLSSLIGMRMPMGKAAKMALAWVAIFAVGFVVFAFRGEFSGAAQRLRAQATGAPVVEGGEIRIPMADDGHFWVDAAVNGTDVRFLVDSGASITTVSIATAKAANVPTDGRTTIINTANGTARVIQAEANRLELSGIIRTDFPIDVNPNDSSNLLGMNFLSSLSGWRVEAGYLVLRP